MNGLKLIGAGRNREVFLLPSEKYVVKVPLNQDGESDNWKEHCWYRKYKSFPYAKCRSVFDSNLLVMEYVEQASIILDEVGQWKIRYYNWFIDCPTWVLSIDCQQVGFNNKGKLVAYDYA